VLAADASQGVRTGDGLKTVPYGILRLEAVGSRHEVDLHDGAGDFQAGGA
jgi:hypothetical protein